MVNVLAPFIITYKILTGMKNENNQIFPIRIINTSSISHTDCIEHLKDVNYDNLQFEKGNWSKYNAYGLSKLLVIMMTRGFKYTNLI